MATTGEQQVNPTEEVEKLDVGNVAHSHSDKLQNMLRELTAVLDSSIRTIGIKEHRIELRRNTRPIAQHPSVLRWTKSP